MPKILIVEDDPFLLKMYSKKFEVEGFEVDTATDGESGLLKIKSFLPDLVLMDVMLPKLNGIEALEKAKSDPNIRHIPIVVLTNLSTTDDAGAAVSKGAAAYWVKSEYTPSQVIARTKQILDNPVRS